MKTDAKRVDGRKARHEHRRPELLELLTEYVLEHGINDLSLRPAAEAIGVTHATLIRHFASKDELIGEVVAKICGDFNTRMQRDLGEATDGLVGYLWGMWQRLCAPGEHRQLLLLFELAARDARNHQYELVDSLIHAFTAPVRAELIAEGRSAEEAAELATLTLAQVRGLQLDLAMSDDRERVDQAMRRFISLLAGPAKS